MRRLQQNAVCQFSWLRLWLVLGSVLGIANRSNAEPPVRDDFSDTWVATDALGRTVATAETAGPPRRDRTVAMFYFLWHDQLGAGHGPFDVSKILAADPKAMQKAAAPPWGPLYAAHHWGESIFGYYLGDDASVLRKHAQMLSDAGVDLIIFDTSNGPTYPRNYRKLFEVFGEMRRVGQSHAASGFPLRRFGILERSSPTLYRDLYSKHLGEELWFRWEGKPLILADPDQVDAELLAFFTFRKPQPSYFVGPDRRRTCGVGWRSIRSTSSATPPARRSRCRSASPRTPWATAGIDVGTRRSRAVVPRRPPGQRARRRTSRIQLRRAMWPSI